MKDRDIESLKLKIFFSYAWKKKTEYCQCGCGRRLPKELNTSNMDHLLDKSKYPELKFSISNIFYCHSECHACKTNGHARIKHGEKIKWALENYDTLKKESGIFEEKLNQIL